MVIRTETDSTNMASLRSGTEQREREADVPPALDPRSSVVDDIARGVVGGLIATAVMTVYRFPIFRALAPTAELWVLLRGGEPEQYPGVGLVLHFLYGAVGGGVFGFIFHQVQFRTARGQRTGSLVLALGYGIVLSFIGTRVVFRRLLGEKLEPDEAAVFHVGHVIYGLTLGTWLSSRERPGEVYD